MKNKFPIPELRARLGDPSLSSIARAYGVSPQNLTEKHRRGFIVEIKYDKALVFSREGKVEKILLERLK